MGYSVWDAQFLKDNSDLLLLVFFVVIASILFGLISPVMLGYLLFITSFILLGLFYGYFTITKSPSSPTKGENQVASESHVDASTSYFGDFSRELLGLIGIGVFYSPILGFIVLSILYIIFRLSSVSNLLITVLLALLLVVLLAISFIGTTEESKRHLSVLEYLLVKRGHTSYLMSY